MEKPGIVPNWSEFLDVAHRQVEERFKLGVSLAIATKMPFEDIPGTLFNPGCFYKSTVFLSKAFIEFAFDKRAPERSATAIAILYHEMGHGFERTFVSPQLPAGAFEKRLRSVPKGYELFADYYAGYLFYFWHRWVRTNLNPQHPTLGSMVAYISSFNHFAWSFKYFGCYVRATAHGDYQQRQKSFIAGAVAAERTGHVSLADLSEGNLMDLALNGETAVSKIARQPGAVIKPDSCS